MSNVIRRYDAVVGTVVRLKNFNADLDGQCAIIVDESSFLGEFTDVTSAGSTVCLIKHSEAESKIELVSRTQIKTCSSITTYQCNQSSLLSRLALLQSYFSVMGPFGSFDMGVLWMVK